MAKDRNTFAKRQRETDKKSKAAEKRERRNKKKQQADDSSETDESQSTLSSQERAVLQVFRKFLMTPGRMLCLGSSDLLSFKKSLVQLTDKGLLVKEKFQGGYSLTEAGFYAMKNGP